jgi:D-3-phosphoglycerate dehydrogenase
MRYRYTVLLYEPMHIQGTRLLEEKCNLVYADSFEPDRLMRQARDVDGIVIRANGAITRPLIECAPRLKVIGRHGVGVENIDLTAAKDHGIAVVYTPEANAESVAEHFVALALMLAKKMGLGDQALRAGKWKARYELIGTELRGKTLGIMGFGRIGQQTARICHQGFGMAILYFDVVGYPEMEKELNAKRVDSKELFTQADFISINLPLLPQTRGMIGVDLLRLMKPTAFVINMARGPVWKESEVVRALKEHWIAGAGSDVYEVEPAPPDNPLLALDNFVGTPHMAGHTEESLTRMSMVARDILAVLEGRPPQFPVPPELYEYSKSG